MTGRVILRPEVPDDLRSIVDYLDPFSIPTSDRFLESVFAAFDDLAAMPGKGSPKHFRSSRLQGVRSWAVPGFRNHLILYREKTGGIEVLAVTHGSRRLRALLLGRV
jgi:plasmid stabilization system protein ParE